MLALFRHLSNRCTKSRSMQTLFPLHTCCKSNRWPRQDLGTVVPYNQRKLAASRARTFLCHTSCTRLVLHSFLLGTFLDCKRGSFDPLRQTLAQLRKTCTGTRWLLTALETSLNYRPYKPSLWLVKTVQHCMPSTTLMQLCFDLGIFHQRMLSTQSTWNQTPIRTNRISVHPKNK